MSNGALTRASRIYIRRTFLREKAYEVNLKRKLKLPLGHHDISRKRERTFFERYVTYLFCIHAVMILWQTDFHLLVISL